MKRSEIYSFFKKNQHILLVLALAGLCISIGWFGRDVERNDEGPSLRIWETGSRYRAFKGGETSYFLNVGRYPDVGIAFHWMDETSTNEHRIRDAKFRALSKCRKNFQQAFRQRNIRRPAVRGGGTLPFQPKWIVVVLFYSSADNGLVDKTIVSTNTEQNSQSILVSADDLFSTAKITEIVDSAFSMSPGWHFDKNAQSPLDSWAFDIIDAHESTRLPPK